MLLCIIFIPVVNSIKGWEQNHPWQKVMGTCKCATPCSKCFINSCRSKDTQKGKWKKVASPTAWGDKGLTPGKHTRTLPLAWWCGRVNYLFIYLFLSSSRLVACKNEFRSLKENREKIQVSFIEEAKNVQYKAQFLSLWTGRHVSESLFIHLRNDTFH